MELFSRSIERLKIGNAAEKLRSNSGSGILMFFQGNTFAQEKTNLTGGTSSEIVTIQEEYRAI